MRPVTCQEIVKEPDRWRLLARDANLAGKPMSRHAPLRPHRWLLHLHDQLPAAAGGRDARAVHQLRVAAARLRVWLELGGRRVLVDDLRWLRGLAGPVRDLDVLLARTPPPDWNAWLRERRRLAVDELKAGLGTGRPQAAVEALARLEPVEAERAKRGWARALRRVRRRGRAAAAEPGCLERVHRLRRALRSLRYASEWLGRKPKALRRLQESLGELNDRDTALRLLEAWPAAASLSEERERLLNERDERHAEALVAWRKAEPKLEDLA